MNGNGPEMLTRIAGSLDALNCGAAMIDRAGTLVHINRRLCAMMQRSCADVIGRNILAFYDDPADRAKLAAGLEDFQPAAKLSLSAAAGRKPDASDFFFANFGRH